jgi:hypothetical protein
MVSVSFYIIIAVFLVYYLLVLFKENRMMDDPKEIMGKFLALLLLYAGISIVYFAITGKPFLGDSVQTYNIYIFLIGFMAILWAIPTLLEEFTFFRKFMNKTKRARKK